jgi:hypothetical protein
MPASSPAFNYAFRREDDTIKLGVNSLAACLFMARNGPPAMSAVWSLTGGKADMAFARADF